MSNTLAPGGCINGSEAFARYVNLMQQRYSYYYYDNKLNEHLPALAELGAQIFSGTERRPFKKLITLADAPETGQLAIEPVGNDLTLVPQAQIGERVVRAAGHQAAAHL